MNAHPDFIAQFEAKRGPRAMTVQQFIASFSSRTRPDGDCLIWTGGIAPTGYGHVSVLRETQGAHRAAYWIATGIKPPPRETGMTIDHLCGNPSCVKPEHLELVTQAENNARSDRILTTRLAKQTHCKHGHEWTPENTKITPRGHRYCRACGRENARKTYWRKRESA